MSSVWCFEVDQESEKTESSLTVEWVSLLQMDMTHRLVTSMYVHAHTHKQIQLSNRDSTFST